MNTGELNAGGNPAMDQHPIQGGVGILIFTACYRETAIISALMGHLARMQNLLFPKQPGLTTLHKYNRNGFLSPAFQTDFMVKLVEITSTARL